MSFKAVDWALERPVDIESKMILIVMGNYTNEFGLSWAGWKAVTRKASVSKSTFFRRIDALEAAGLFEIIRRWDLKSGAQRSNVYLFPGHELADKETFEEVMGDTLVKYADYSAAWVKQSGGAGCPADTGPQVLPDTGPSVPGNQGRVSPGTTYTVIHKPIRDTKRTGSSRFEAETSVPVNPDHAERVDLTLEWLRQRKGLKQLPPQEWLTCLISLDKQGIDLSCFREFYTWVEKLDWVTGAVSPKLLETQVEAWVRRDELAEKRVSKGRQKDAGTRGGDALRIYRGSKGRG
jgi:hypothetical protein